MHIAPRRLIFFGMVAIAATSGESCAAFVVTNLVSDIAGLAANTDPNLRNPWGVSYAPTGPFWVSDQRTSQATLYNGSGAALSLVVPMATTTGGPTGQVWNGNKADFLLPSNGNSAIFLFANLNGQIQGWNGGAAQTVITGAGVAYTGLAIGQVVADNVLFAADARGGKIDVFNSAYLNLNATTYAGAFVDPGLPTGFKPFNIQNLGGTLYVTYDNTSTLNGGSAATNGGVVATYGLDGHFIKQLIANGPGGPLEDPWGVVLAPSSFGQFGGDLLVGNKEAGTINAFDPTSGAFLGLVATVTNDPTSTNNGLWALTFGNGGTGGRTDTLYAFAGINNEVDGLMVSISAVPEPGSAVLLGIGGALAVAVARRRRGAARG